MKLSAKAAEISNGISDKTKLGELRSVAKQIKKDHALAMELWASGAFILRQLSILIMDPKQLTQQAIDRLDYDIQQISEFEKRTQLIDWLMANQFAKDKKTILLMQSWEHSPSVLQRRTFWYYQARLRWTGQVPPSNTEALLSSIEKRIENEHPEVQWAMNFTAGQIGIFQPEFRSRCISLGERTGLYQNEVVSKGCTTNYLPEFIAVQVSKLKR